MHQDFTLAQFGAAQFGAIKSGYPIDFDLVWALRTARNHRWRSMTLCRKNIPRLNSSWLRNDIGFRRNCPEMAHSQIIAFPLLDATGNATATAIRDQ